MQILMLWNYKLDILDVDGASNFGADVVFAGGLQTLFDACR